jgi:hypothetical protein
MMCECGWYEVYREVTTVDQIMRDALRHWEKEGANAGGAPASGRQSEVIEE